MHCSSLVVCIKAVIERCWRWVGKDQSYLRCLVAYERPSRIWRQSERNERFIHNPGFWAQKAKRVSLENVQRHTHSSGTANESQKGIRLDVEVGCTGTSEWHATLAHFQNEKRVRFVWARDIFDLKKTVARECLRWLRGQTKIDDIKKTRNSERMQWLTKAKTCPYWTWNNVFRRFSKQFIKRSRNIQKHQEGNRGLKEGF